MSVEPTAPAAQCRPCNIDHAFATPAAITNRDGIIQLSELVASVSARVKQDVEAIKQIQTPTVSRRDLVGDFAVGPRL